MDTPTGKLSLASLEISEDATFVLTMTEAHVLAHTHTQLAAFKCPKAVVFVDSLPKNPSGKLLKRELRQRFAGRYEGG